VVNFIAAEIGQKFVPLFAGHSGTAEGMLGAVGLAAVAFAPAPKVTVTFLTESG